MRVKLTIILSAILLKFTLGIDIYYKDSVKIITDAKYIDDSTILVIDTLKKTDTMFIYIDNINKFSYDIWFNINPMVGLNNYYSNNNNFNTIVNQLNNEITKKINYKMCISLHANYYNFQFVSGIQYLNFKENISHNPQNFLIDLIPYQKLDTVSTWGQIIKNDTSYIIETEWNTYYNYDTTYLNKNYSNKYQYIEIPFEIGKRFIIKQYNIDITAGLINQFYLSKNDILLLDSEKNLNRVDIKKVRKYNISYSININFNYHLSNNFGLIYGINLNKSALSIFEKDYYYFSKPTLIGFKVGVIYRL